MVVHRSVRLNDDPDANPVPKIRTGKWMKAFWDEIEPGFLAKHQSVALLRKRLKELHQAQR
jgi:hypothetical protein